MRPTLWRFWDLFKFKISPLAVRRGIKHSKPNMSAQNVTPLKSDRNAQKPVGQAFALTHVPGAVMTDIEALNIGNLLAFRFDTRQKRFVLQGDLAVLGAQNISFHPRLDDFSPLVSPEALNALVDYLNAATKASEPLRLTLARRDGEVLHWVAGHSRKGEVVGHISAVLTAQTTDAETGVHALIDRDRDLLTGLLNRTGFLKAAMVLLSAPTATEVGYDLVVADLNRFSRLNEALGHSHADLVLSVLADRLRADFSPQALIGRLGEDEFAVLTQRGFPRVSDQMRQSLERPLTVAGYEICPTFSMGAVGVEGGDDAPDPSELLRRAQMAVDVAKTKGVWGVAAYKRDLETDGLSRLALESDLRKALVSGEIVPYFQPIVDMKTGGTEGFEALVRWEHPKAGLIPPDAFLSVARDLGLMPAVGHIVLTQSLKALKTLQETGFCGTETFMSVNLSAQEIERSRLVDDIWAIMTDVKIKSRCVKLEVTESDIMRDPQASAKVLSALRETGAGVSLDDFGTGFSSLSHLARLPMDTLKIDRSFVKTLLSDETSEKIVRSVLVLGRDLGLEVVAEGVEDNALRDKLIELGCVLGQGYGFARPMPYEAVKTYLKS